MNTQMKDNMQAVSTQKKAKNEEIAQLKEKIVELKKEREEKEMEQ